MNRRTASFWKRALSGILPALLLAATAPTWAGMNRHLDRNDVRNIIVQEARDSDIPPSLALAVAKVGSNFEPDTMSTDGRQGIMQVDPRVAWEVFGIDTITLSHPRLNVRLGIQYLEKLVDRYGRWDLALSYYKGGYKVGTPPDAEVLPETREFVEEVMRWEQRFRREHIERQVGNVRWPMSSPYRSRCDERYVPEYRPAELDDYDLGRPIDRGIRPGQLDDIDEIRWITRHRNRNNW